MLFEADPAPTNWTRRCLRQADRVLLVARAGDPPGPGRVEEELLTPVGAATSARRELVLLHGRGVAEPTGTSAWLQGRQVDGHHHLREG
ncbi:MAG: hypothetical protein ACR2G7_09890 [Acidimicrobiales bacterium]